MAGSIPLPRQYIFQKSQRFANSQRSHNEMLVYGKIGVVRFSIFRNRLLLCKTKTVVNNENPLLYAKYIIYFQKSSFISYMNVKSYWPLKIQVKKSL